MNLMKAHEFYASQAAIVGSIGVMFGIGALVLESRVLIGFTALFAGWVIVWAVAAIRAYKAANVEPSAERATNDERGTPADTAS